MERFDLGSDYYRALLIPKSLRIGGEVGKYEVRIDPQQEYFANSYGYRCPEFEVNTEIIFGGCSFTHGTGVPEDRIWSSVVAKSLNLKYATLAQPGVSIPWIIEKVFNFIHRYGKPKVICLLFPDPFRYFLPADGEILIGRKKNPPVEYGTVGSMKTQSLINGRSADYREVQDYSKKPHDMDQVISRDMSVYLSIKSIRALEQYCEDLSIKLVWSTWDIGFSRLIELANQDQELKFNGYFNMFESGSYFYKKIVSEGEAKDAIFGDFDTYKYCKNNHENHDCSCYGQCHTDLLELYGQDQFDNGTDTTFGVEHAHPGVHLQAHFAEAFLQKLL
jgi:hypothetical protein